MMLIDVSGDLAVERRKHVKRSHCQGQTGGGKVRGASLRSGKMRGTLRGRL